MFGFRSLQYGFSTLVTAVLIGGCSDDPRSSNPSNEAKRGGNPGRQDKLHEPEKNDSVRALPDPKNFSREAAKLAGFEVYRTIYEAAGRDFPGALQWAADNNVHDGDRQIFEHLVLGSKEPVDELIRLVSASLQGAKRSYALQAVIMRELKNPRGNLSQALAGIGDRIPEETKGRLIVSGLSGDPQRLESLLSGGQKDSPVLRALFTVAATGSAVPHELRTQMILNGLKSEAITDIEIRRAMNQYAATQPDKAMELVVSNPESPQMNVVAHQALASWAVGDPEAAGEWLKTHLTNPQKDFLIAGYVSAARAIDLEAANVWMRQITNQSALQMATQNTVRGGPPARLRKEQKDGP